ncbi:diamine acetyltransferase 1-like [Exaiptasia diaphana]|uniref:N-acetyltransferase domain-containing protein n=1 Tax=Exaiptasia diaphana TaxID=2652724 RepID=A0A913XEG6_EXADI|nr:diamine acetyltransferase 1-like [Exaiptasia diaphana]
MDVPKQLYQVRKATKDDVPEIARLIKGLAEYLGETDRLKIGEAELTRDGFGERPLFHCLVAEELVPRIPVDEQEQRNSKPILGIAIYFFTYSTWEGSMLYLEDLFVIPFARGQGIGTTIMKALAKVAKENNCSRVQWMSPQGRPSVNFYHKLGAECLGDWFIFRLGQQKLDEITS